MTSEWHDWHDFYMLLGTSSAALVALLFVAVSIGASFLTPERSIATSTFMSPVVFHFATILLLSLVALVPSHTTVSLAVGIARSEEHTSELQSLTNLVCRLLLEKKKQ